MDSKVFWSVLLALLVFSGVMFTLFALGIVGARAAADEAQKQVVTQLRQQAAASRQQQQDRQRDQLARRQLTGKQRCVGGVVVVVDGSTFSQLGAVGDPVRCSGGYADRAIR